MKKKKKAIITIIILFLISISLIGTGIYLNQFSKTSYMMGKGIDFIQDKITHYIFNNRKSLEDNFSLTGSIKFALKSDYYKKTPNDKLIQNLNQLSSNLTAIHSRKTEQVFVSIEEKIKNENVFVAKNLIENSTEYYQIDGIVENYIDNGTCNYFESFTKKVTLDDNIDYLYNSLFSSFKKSLKEEYFYRREATESIDGKETKVIEVSIDITDNLLHDILNDTLKHMKKDSRTHQILSSTFKDFDKYEIASSKELIKSDESYKITISFLKQSHKPYKFQLDYLKNEARKRYLYMGNEQEGTIFYLENDRMIYFMDTHFDDKYIKVSIYNASKKPLGELQIEWKDVERMLHYSFDNDKKHQELTYIESLENNQNNKTYDRVGKLSLKIEEDGILRLGGDIDINIHKENKAIVDETVTDLILYAKLTQEQKDLIHNKWSSFQERLKK